VNIDHSEVMHHQCKSTEIQKGGALNSPVQIPRYLKMQK
jgi:hypothetical protein